MHPGYEVFGYLLTNVLFVAGLIVLRYKCMNAKDDTFQNNYCLSNSHMRTAISAILTIITYSLYAAIFDSIKYYRVMKLKSGINEGVYITLVSNNPLYFMKSLLTRWFYIILILAASVTGHLIVQPLANLGIKTVNVYIKNSTVAVYNNDSMYNGATEGFITDVQFYFPLMMSVLNTYSTSWNSIYGMGGDGIIAKEKIGVTTNIIRNGYVIRQQIIDSNPSNSFKNREVVGILTTACNIDKPIQYDNAFSFAANNGVTLSHIYFIEYEILSPNEASFTTAFGVGKNDELLSSSVCFSRLVIQEYDIIYTVNTGTVSNANFVTNTTTVDISQLLQIVTYYAESIEIAANMSNSIDFQSGLHNVFITFGTGLFELPTSNICHSRLFGAISLGLQYLWEKFLNNQTDTVFVPLSNKVLITYISIVDLWIISGSILVFTFIVCMFGIKCSFRCPLPVKSFNENRMIDNNTYVWEKMNKSILPSTNKAQLGSYFMKNISYRNGRVGY